jgi:hypothetical protein
MVIIYLFIFKYLVSKFKQALKLSHTLMADTMMVNGKKINSTEKKRSKGIFKINLLMCLEALKKNTNPSISLSANMFYDYVDK